MRRPFLFILTAAITALVLALFPNPAAAECVTVTPNQYRADVIFAGTLVEKEVVSRFAPNAVGLVRVTDDGEDALRDRTAFGLRLTFDVQQVWKGPARKTMIVYQVLDAESSDHLKPNTEYLILANRLSDQDRSSVFLGPDEEAFRLPSCSRGAVWTADVQRDVQRALGRSRRPE